MVFHDVANREWKELLPGGSYIIPGEVRHTATAVADTILFEIFSPVREEYK